MSQPKLADLVDKGFELSQTIRSLTKELDDIKLKLKAHGRKTEKSIIEGTKAEARFGGQSTVTTDPLMVYDTYVEVGKEDAFWEAVHIQFPKVEGHLGKTLADSLKEIQIDPWGRLTFVKK